ncbi:MAG: DnaD domain protein [Chloroflexi bacterium]|nr:DnaD domain protein [Chloroflexota bacterium]
MKFEGFPAGKVRFARIPGPFFSELLPQIDHLGELKVTLYALWRLDRMEGGFRYLTEADFLEDSHFIGGLADSPEGAEATLKESLVRSVERGTFLKAKFAHGEGEVCLYFFNSPKGRAAVQAIQAGEWRPSDDTRIPAELAPERPNIYHLYEENIGPMTPLLAETLQDAEDTYPAQWIREALRIAVEKNVRNWRYVEAILRRWHERGYDAPEARRDTEKSRRQYSAWEED